MELVVCNSFFQDDFTLKGYRRHRESVDAPPPLTEAEQLLQDIKLSEVSGQINCQFVSNYSGMTRMNNVAINCIFSFL